MSFRFAFESVPVGLPVVDVGAGWLRSGDVVVDADGDGIMVGV